MLSEAEARRGVTYAGSGAPLRRLAAKLLAGQAVKIVTIGGSVTQGGGMLGVSLRPVATPRWLQRGMRMRHMQHCFTPVARPLAGLPAGAVSVYKHHFSAWVRLCVGGGCNQCE